MENIKVWIHILLSLNILDIVSTLMFMSIGLKEGNPIMKYLFDINIFFGISVKLIIMYYAVLFLYYGYKKFYNHKFLRILFYYPIIFYCWFYYTIVIQNFMGFLY